MDMGLVKHFSEDLKIAIVANILKEEYDCLDAEVGTQTAKEVKTAIELILDWFLTSEELKKLGLECLKK